MQEPGVPVTYAYISDAHDFHVPIAGNAAPPAFGPGRAAYVQQLKAYDQAFAAFFQRPAHDGINESNTLFVFTVDEGDHFAGVAERRLRRRDRPVPVRHEPGRRDQRNIERFQRAGSGRLPHGQRRDFNFTVHGDDAPTFYCPGNPAGRPHRCGSFERAAADLTGARIRTPGMTAADADEWRWPIVGREKALHMSTAIRFATPTFAIVRDPDYFLTDFPRARARRASTRFAWNHGDIQPEIANTWLGFVGPGVQQERRRRQDVDRITRTSAPTILSLLGLKSTTTRPTDACSSGARRRRQYRSH